MPALPTASRALSGLLIAAADAEGPAGRVVGTEDAVVGLEAAPGRDVAVGGGIVGEHGDDRADRDVADLLGQHDDRDGALAAERVDSDQRRRTGRDEGR